MNTEGIIRVISLTSLFMISVVSFGQTKKNVVYSTGHYSYKGELVDNKGTKLTMNIYGKEKTLSRTGTIYYDIDNQYDSKTPVLYFLEKENKIGLIIDYSDAILDDMNYDERIKLESGWNTASTKYESWMRNIISNQIEDRGVEIVKEDEDYSYVLLVKVIRVEDNGDNILHCYIYTKNDISNPVVTFIVHGKGGGKGVFTYLMGKGLQDAADIIGENIKKNMVKIKPKNLLTNFRTHELYIDYATLTYNRTKPLGSYDTFVNEVTIPMNGIGLGYLFNIKLSKKLPIVASTGLNINYSFGTYSYGMPASQNKGKNWYAWHDWDAREDAIRYVYCSFPLKIEYRIAFRDFNFVPTIGTGLKLNIYSKEIIRNIEPEYKEVFVRNMLTETQEYGKGKRVQPFGIAGLDLSYRNWVIGGLFHYDIINFNNSRVISIYGNTQETHYCKENYSTFQFKIGYRF